MANDVKERLLDEAWGGSAFALSGEDMARAFPGGFEEASRWCAENGMTVEAGTDGVWAVERAPVPAKGT